jgi:hypothetical protein
MNSAASMEGGEIDEKWDNSAGRHWISVAKCIV